MTVRFARWMGALSLVFLVLALGACTKKTVAAKVTPPPPPPAAPTATISASPADLQTGQSTTLTWHTENANEISIDGLGTVAASGTKMVSPAESTTYKLMAKGPGGSQEASARVTVTAPPPVAAAPTPTDEELFAQNVKDLFFDYDKYQVKSDEDAVLKADAAFLAAHPAVKITISGHCDERGSEDYNLALGSNRADTVRDQLVGMGVSKDRIKTISYGKEKPFCTQENDQCWQENRRAHFQFGQ
jgi:peptidoglycan-associated lipoprotein